ncbi:Carbonic anhydrase [Alphaproteobacteria bacterium SO-S41]|nr:Carbonic anhydrase [Alphaproteobacteria bacterium SO-S41]
MDKLIAGYRRFRANFYEHHKAEFEHLSAKGQKPSAMIIGCSDARVDPAINFDTGPGEVFMVRNVANVVPPYAPDSDHHGTSAALEFAVKGLDIPNIVILGHAKCGGIAALVDAEEDAEMKTDFLDLWMSVARPARRSAIAQAEAVNRADDRTYVCRLCERANVLVGIANLRTFPWIAEREKAGTLKLHGWYFDITKGELYRKNDLDEFELVPPTGE